MVRDMTKGKPLKLILAFCIPLIFGNLFQQMYNMVDSIIVGRFVGVDALAAVGATGSLHFLIIGFVNGLCTGFTIPVAQYFGASDERNMRRCITNSIWLALMVGSVLTILTLVFTRQLLTLMQTPKDIFVDSYQYIFILFAGIFATVLYNLVSGVLRALGDSKTPLYFLILASILNIILDLLFILVFSMRVAGAALATVLSQAVSGILCLIYAKKHYPILKMQKGDWNMSGLHMIKLIGMGLPMGLQFSITAIGSTLLQSAVNTLGSSIVAAITAANKVQMLVTQAMETLGVTMATFCGQNLGAHKPDRIHKGILQSLAVGIGYSVLAFLIVTFFGKIVALLFISKEETDILNHVQKFLFLNGAFYPFLTILLILRNSIQGMSHGILAMGAGIFEMIARSIVAFLLVGQFGFTAVCFANPCAWVAANLLLVPAYFYVNRKLRRPIGTTP